MPMLKWNLYIRSIANDARQNRQLHRSLKEISDYSCNAQNLQETAQAENRELLQYMCGSSPVFTLHSQ